MSASSIETNDTNVSTVVSDTTDLTKLSAEELLDVVATLRQENKTLLKARNKVGLTFKRIPEDGNDSIARLEDGQFPFLTKIDSLSVTKDTSTDGNIALIEGENLAVLSALQMTHKEKVDVIYIDPPYNTGNDDFIYEDKRLYGSTEEELENLEKTLDGKARTVGKDDPFRHSKWLSFMERRLFLAKELLSDTGVIFVSIDDNEQARLKLLMDNVFGSDNFIASMVWEKRTKSQNTLTAKTMLQIKSEYILVYKASQRNNSFNLKVSSTKAYNLFDDKGSYREKRIEEMSAIGMRGRATMVFPILGVSPNSGKQWKIGQDQVNRLIEHQEIELINGRPSIRIRPSNEDSNSYSPFWSLLPKESVGTAETGKLELSKILKDSEFETIKPLALLKKILFHSSKKDSIILDFFAGSGTTGHAVAELNKEDGGNRSAILVTNNEGGIARNVTRERLARVLTGENWADGKEHEPLPGNLSFYTLGFKTLSSNPLTTAQMMESKFDGLLSLENNALNVVENDPDEDYAIYRNSGKVVFVWKNLFSLYDGECEELLESLKNTMDADEYIAYIPSESETPGITSDGWEIVSFPHEYIERYEAMIATMRRNQTLPNSNK